MQRESSFRQRGVQQIRRCGVSWSLRYVSVCLTLSHPLVQQSIKISMIIAIEFFDLQLLVAEIFQCYCSNHICLTMKNWVNLVAFKKEQSRKNKRILIMMERGKVCCLSIVSLCHWIIACSRPLPLP